MVVKKKPKNKLKSKLEIENLKLRTEILGLKNKIEDLEKRGYKRELIDVGLGDPSPTDKEKRRLYVGSVAHLHTDFLRPKLIQMISTLHNLLEDSTNDRESDQAVKGSVYALREIISWGDLMVSEFASYNQDNSDKNSENKPKEDVNKN